MRHRFESILLLLCLLTSAQAEEGRKILLDDGTEMALTRSGDDGLNIVYGNEVPPTLRELGVVPGTILVQGRWDDTILVGEAYAFAAGCKPIAYPIRGVVDRSGTLVIIGPVPNSCAGDDRVWNKQAIMRFTPPAPVTASAPVSARKVKRVEKAKPPPPPPKPRVRRQPTQPTYWPQQQWRWW